MTIRQRVEKRAKGKCEYCQAPQYIAGYTFHLEHITPRVKGGENSYENYALSCFMCNGRKSSHTTGIDPESQKEEPLFNPRTQNWDDHFEWKEKYQIIEGKTPVGRATVARLLMNSGMRVTSRKHWVNSGAWP